MLTDIAWTLLLLTLLSIPLGISGWAFLDAARRPRWVWAFAGRSQVVWMVMIGFGVATVLGGLAVSILYLTKIRVELTAVEAGNFDH